MDSTDALSRSRCRERRLNKSLRCAQKSHEASRGLSTTAELLVFF